MAPVSVWFSQDCGHFEKERGPKCGHHRREIISGEYPWVWLAPPRILHDGEVAYFAENDGDDEVFLLMTLIFGAVSVFLKVVKWLLNSRMMSPPLWNPLETRRGKVRDLEGGRVAAHPFSHHPSHFSPTFETNP